MREEPMSYDEYAQIMSKANLDKDDLVKMYYLGTSPSAVQTQYDLIAVAYEEFVDKLEYQTPEILLDLLEKNNSIKQEDKILDIGAGTGLLADLLISKGYKTISATDISEKMLDIAKEKNIYEDIRKADLSIEMPYEENSFDLAIAAGVTEVAPAEFLINSLKMLKPGAYLCFNLEIAKFQDLDTGYKAVIDKLVEEDMSFIAKTTFTAHKAVAEGALPVSQALLYTIAADPALVPR